MTEQEKSDIEFISNSTVINNLFSRLPFERRTADVCKYAVEKIPQSIEHVPRDLQTEELCLTAVRKDGETLKYVPETIKTSQMCMEAVSNSGWALEFVPEALKTTQMCYTALETSSAPGGEDYEILAFIPFSDVCLEGLKKFEYSFVDPINVFGSINPKIMTEEIALYGIKMEPSCLGFIPEHLRNTEIYMQAVEGDGLLLSQIPEQLRSKEMCETAVQSNFHAMKYVPEEQKTPELCQKALQNNAFAIQYFKPEQLTREVCYKAFHTATHLRILYFIPFIDMHEQILEIHCNTYTQVKNFLDNMNPDYMTLNLMKMIFNKEPELFFNIPARFKDRNLCELAVRFDGSYLQYVPEELKTRELCIEAINKSPYAIKYIPEAMKSLELYRNLVQVNPKNLVGIPASERTYEMCKIAFDNTYGKNKDDTSIIGALTIPSLVLQIFQEQDNPEKIHDLMNAIKPNIMTEQIVLEAVRKNGKILYLVPQQVITPQIAEAAVEKEPSSLQWIPLELRTPEMYLCTKKAIQDYHIFIPDHVLSGDNIYSFSLKVEQTLGKSLCYDQHKRLYAGETVSVGNVERQTGNMDICVVRYDRDTGKLYMHDGTPCQTKHQQRNQPSEITPGKKKPKLKL